MGKLDGKVALVTGGNSGIGKAAALLFAQEGAAVIIAARDADKGEQTAASIRAEGGSAAFVACDVRQAEACERAAAFAREQFGRIDVLFNNAGIVPFGTILETSDAIWRDAWETNVSGTFYMSRAVLPAMIEQGHGVIVNNASDWGVVGGSGALAYATTKGAVVQFTRSLALDHARQGIRVNAICPGDTVVDRWRTRSSDESEFQRYLGELGAGFPMGRVGTPEEIARGVLFLASDDSSYMTGQLLVLDGGNTAGGTSTRY